MFTAPGQLGEYLLYDRTYAYASNGGGAGVRRHGDPRSS